MDDCTKTARVNVTDRERKADKLDLVRVRRLKWLRTELWIARVLARFFGWPFWLAERCAARLADELERRRS
jgi:hypothetical protein